MQRKGTISRGVGRTKIQITGEDGSVLDTSKRLQRMKAQSKKTFKFRKTRRRGGTEERSPGEGKSVQGTIVEQSPPLPTATTATQTSTTTTVGSAAATATTATVKAKNSSVLKPVSLTATVIRRAKQRKKLGQKPGVEIVIDDDDSISSTRTSSTVGYRDSFGDNDDGCFHLLER